MSLDFALIDTALRKLDREAEAGSDLAVAVSIAVQFRVEIARLKAILADVHDLHTDSVASVCPSCHRLTEAHQSEVDDGLVGWPCPTLQAMGYTDARPGGEPS